MNRVKSPKFLSLLVAIVSFEMYSMMPAHQDLGSLELQLINGEISTQRYLLSVEYNPKKWRGLSGKLNMLRTVDYSHYHVNLYNQLLYVVNEGILPTIRRFAEIGYQHQGQQYNAIVTRQVIEDITAHINLLYSNLTEGLRNGQILIDKSS